MTSARERTRALNDELRKHHRGGRIVVTQGVAQLDACVLRKIEDALSAFDEFDEANDPHGEHDFGGFDVEGHEILFKIDYYDSDLICGSPDPSDPAKTQRVLTLMLAEEY